MAYQLSNYSSPEGIPCPEAYLRIVDVRLDRVPFAFTIPNSDGTQSTVVRIVDECVKAELAIYYNKAQRDAGNPKLASVSAVIADWQGATEGELQEFTSNNLPVPASLMPSTVYSDLIAATPQPASTASPKDAALTVTYAALQRLPGLSALLSGAVSV